MPETTTHHPTPRTHAHSRHSRSTPEAGTSQVSDNKTHPPPDRNAGVGTLRYVPLMIRPSVPLKMTEIGSAVDQICGSDNLGGDGGWALLKQASDRSCSAASLHQAAHQSHTSSVIWPTSRPSRSRLPLLGPLLCDGGPPREPLDRCLPVWLRLEDCDDMALGAGGVGRGAWVE